MSAKTISRFPVPELKELPEDIRERILAVQEKSGFVPNVFLVLAHRPDEFRAFFAYHDALMEKRGRTDEGRARNDCCCNFWCQSMYLLCRSTRCNFKNSREKPASSRPDCN